MEAGPVRWQGEFNYAPGDWQALLPDPLNAPAESYLTAQQALTLNTPLTPIEYASQLLAVTSAAELNANRYTVDSQAYSWSPALASGNAAFAYADHTSSTVYIYHGAYTGPTQSTTLAALQLPATRAAQLETQFSAQRSALGLAPLTSGAYTVLFIGLAFLAAATAIAIFAPSAPAFIFLFQALVVAGVITVVLGALAATLTPTVQSQTCNAAGTSCCSLVTGVGQSGDVCADCSSGSCTTQYTPGPGALNFSWLYTLALGLAAVGAVAIGGYVAYRFVSGRPRPGFGNAPSRSAPVAHYVATTAGKVGHAVGTGAQRAGGFIASVARPAPPPPA